MQQPPNHDERNIRPRTAPGQLQQQQQQQQQQAVAAPVPVYKQLVEKHYIPPPEVCSLLFEMSFKSGNKKIETEYWAESLKHGHTIRLVNVVDKEGNKLYIFMRNDTEWTSPLSNLQEFSCQLVDNNGKALHDMKIITAVTQNSVYFVRSPIGRAVITQEELNQRSALLEDEYDA